MLIANEDGLKVNQIDAQFEILAFADSEMDPMDFNKTPAKAISLALARAKLSLEDVSYFEINEVSLRVIEGVFDDGHCEYEIVECGA